MKLFKLSLQASYFHEEESTRDSIGIPVEIHAESYADAALKLGKRLSAALTPDEIANAVSSAMTHKGGRVPAKPSGKAGKR